MEDLLAEIERKRKSIDDNEITSNKKFFRRGDIIHAQREEIIRERNEKETQRVKDLLLKSNESGKSFKSQSNIDDKPEKDTLIPRDEVIRRLRVKNLPIRLFGESDIDSCQRLKLAEIMEQEENKGLTNDFQQALEKMDQAVLLEVYNSEKNQKPKDFNIVDDTTTLEAIKEAAKSLTKHLDVAKDSEIILSFLKLMLSIWAIDLNKRTLDEKGSLQGKMEGARYEQTYSYIKPLFKKLRTKTLGEDILKHLKTIVHYCLERDYVKANDAYLQMAIGNAPWPIGVTMVGIHARTGRERIAVEHVAHVLNDETQRKYIQALKRLMTYCQRTFKTKPSKSVEYGALDGTYNNNN